MNKESPSDGGGVKGAALSTGETRCQLGRELSRGVGMPKICGAS